MKKKLTLMITVFSLIGSLHRAKAQDMSASALVTPSASLCVAANQTVSISITNNDINPIDFSLNNCPVIVTVSGPISQSYTTVVSTGTLAASATQDVVITTGADFSTAGTYTIDANTALAGDLNPSNDAMMAVEVMVNALPNITIHATKTIICAGVIDTLTAHGAVTYTWTPGNYQTASISGTIHSNKTFTLTGTDANGCINEATQLITVNPLPTVTVNAPVICAGETATLTAGGADTYTWSTTAMTASISAAPGQTTDYTVTGTDANNCVNTATTSIAVNPIPTVTVNAPVICAGETATLTAVGADTYTWSTMATTASISASPGQTTDYTVTGTDANNCVNTATASISVSALPTLTIVASNTTMCIGSTETLTVSGASTYTWSNTGETTASISPSPTVTTNYTVTGVDANHCMNTDAITIVVNSCSSDIASNRITSTITLFPNPNNGSFTIKGTKELLDLRIFNELGQVVQSVSLTQETNYEVILSGLNKGIYFLIGGDTNTQIKQRIIISN